MPNSNPQRFDRAELADFYEKLVLYFELNADSYTQVAP